MQLGYVHSEAALGGQSFAGQFEQHSFIHSGKVSHIPDRSLSLDLGATCAVCSTQTEAIGSQESRVARRAADRQMKKSSPVGGRRTYLRGQSPHRLRAV